MSNSNLVFCILTISKILVISYFLQRSHVEKLAKSPEEAAFVGDMSEVYKITSELVNTNTKADPPVLDLNGNILSTDEEKLNRWKEHLESVFNQVVSSNVPPFAAQKLFTS